MSGGGSSGSGDKERTTNEIKNSKTAKRERVEKFSSVAIELLTVRVPFRC